jgi:hypothetical protein
MAGDKAGGNVVLVCNKLPATSYRLIVIKVTPSVISRFCIEKLGSCIIEAIEKNLVGSKYAWLGWG